MPLADLPYRIATLAKEGQYAHLTRPPTRVAKTEIDDPEKKKTKAKTVTTKLRVLRDVNLCDGPDLWQGKKTQTDEVYGFYTGLRLFATRSMVEDYLASPELESYCSASGIPIPTIKDEDLIITEDKYLSEEVVAIIREEYAQKIQSREKDLSFESLEQLICQLKGVDSIESPKRRRVKKESTPLSERPAAAKKKKEKITLRMQLALVQNTPSRVIDVSKFAESMQNQNARILNRVTHAEKIKNCVSLELFPIISDNVAGFTRAMESLGEKYIPRIEEFKTRFTQRQ